MTLLNQALRGAQHRGRDALVRQLSLLLVGGGGALGSAVLAEALVAGRFSRVQALVDGPIASALRGFEPLPAVALDGPAALAADIAVIVFERQRHSNRRDEAFVQPDPEQLLPLARSLNALGLRHLLVVLPHAPALLPHALRHGLATLDEGAVAALGFSHLVFVRAAQAARAARGGSWLQRLANWWLSQLRLMIPSAEQPLRAAVLAGCVVQLARLLHGSPAGTRVLAPEALTAASSADGQGLEAALSAWLHRAPPP